MNASQVKANRTTRGNRSSLTGWTTLLAVVPLSGAAVAAPLADPAVRPVATQVKDVRISVGHSQVVQAPWLVEKVSVADPEIADVQVVTPNQVLLVAKKLGSTDLVMWNEEGQTMQQRVIVDLDLERIRAELKEFLPGSQVELTQSGDVVAITGTLMRAEHGASLRRYMETASINYVDMTDLAGLQQVQLQCKIAEANRDAVRALNINWFSEGDDVFGGVTIGGNNSNIDIGVAGGAAVGGTGGGTKFVHGGTSIGQNVTAFLGFPKSNLQLFFEALEDNQFVRLLAEPTLVALSGQEASFLAGGEYPVPIVQGSGVGAGTTITIRYKEFGVRLNFKPTVLGDGRVRLNVEPEVSQLSDQGAVIIEGFRIPSLVVRRAQTTVELNDGQTFAMAGLIDRRITARMQEIPGIGAIPILGTLFRSVRYEEQDTELLVLVTVSLVEALDKRGDVPGPGEAHVRPSDWELYMLGKLRGETPPKISLDQKALLEGMGLDRLKGPGAWSTFEQSPVMTRPKPPAVIEDETTGVENEPEPEPAQPEENDVN